MRVSTVIAGLAASAPVFAQRPTNTSMCSYYTTALLKEDTGANQLTLLTLLVNTVVIGNYTKPNVGVVVPGILAKGTYMGTEVDLLPYFNGGLASSNRGGSSGVAINFLDDGGAAPLMKNMPSNGVDSKQYKLLTHLYQYVGALLGCSATGFPSYSGMGSQASVHKFMDLDAAEVGWFIQNVALAAASFGVAQDDIAIIGKSLNTIFNVKCAPPTTVIPAQGPQLQSICVADDCVLAPNATCAAYPIAIEPAVANATLAGNSTSMSNSTTSSNSTSPKSTSSVVPSSYTGDAVKAAGTALGAGLLGLIAFVF